MSVKYNRQLDALEHTEISQILCRYEVSSNRIISLQVDSTIRFEFISIYKVLQR